MRGLAYAFALLLAGVFASPATTIDARGVATGMMGQQPGTAVPSGTTFRTSTELVALNVTVTDSRDRYVTGLSKDDFAVFEDGIPQDVTFFAATSVPLDLAIMIDTSASMADKIGFALEAAINATAPHGSTALYTSLYVALEDLGRLARRQGDVRRQAIIVLTDGEDTSSLLSFDDLMDVAKRSGVVVYPISVISQFDTKKLDDGGSRRFITESDFSLKSLTQETGGRSFFPMELKDLNGVYQQIAEELTSQYSLAYAPTVFGDGAFHRLLVRVLHHPDARSRTRSGYYASRPLRISLIGSDSRQ
jgi:Ca-activated chloride channel family protein